MKHLIIITAALILFTINTAIAYYLGSMLFNFSPYKTPDLAIIAFGYMVELFAFLILAFFYEMSKKLYKKYNWKLI
jgi:hypothetical protein